MDYFTVEGNLLDLDRREIYPAAITVQNGRIEEVKQIPRGGPDFILPGFVDAHVHIESSMLLPSEFARLATPHGTVATVSDPHEIGNVLGIEGIRYMMRNAKKTPLKVFFGAPSCVPATVFETAGAEVTDEDIESLFRDDGLLYLSEMMNYPGVIHKDQGVLKKIEVAKRYGRPIDGHAPGLTGKEAEEYFKAGISTDHECFTLDEATFKASLGVHILIREGSAAKNFEALHPLFKTHPRQLMLCSDDKHPDDLLRGHINQLAARCLAKGYPLFDVLEAACRNPVRHYGLPVGQLKRGDPADFIVVKDLKTLEVEKTYIDGQLVALKGKTTIQSVEEQPINHFRIGKKQPKDFSLKSEGGKMRVISALPNEIVTDSLIAVPKVENGAVVSDVVNDILKIAVVNRYKEAPPAIGFIKGIGLKKGALAASVAHDSHNIIVVGVDDASITQAVNALIAEGGGLSVAYADDVEVLSLPVAGLMSLRSGQEVASEYERLNARAKSLGTPLYAPFMTLSFMALLVIPKLKMSDKGLFDGEAFKPASLFFDYATIV
ncbi:adenine deaminase [Estrella lausannensis]|uniref:Adenine deaminase n=1 Tax=Estrella lausannensis TaxID=483423 RepID=A0A0H5E4Z0_9BACT|nr:adenine deaminase [Estrella lausannensis]CRX38310.1 Adenine deaminase [Estrella lausannensis]